MNKAYSTIESWFDDRYNDDCAHTFSPPHNVSNYSRERIPPMEVGAHSRGHNRPFISAHSSKYFASNLHSSVSVTAEHMKRLKQKSLDCRFPHVANSSTGSGPASFSKQLLNSSPRHRRYAFILSTQGISEPSADDEILPEMRRY